VTESSHSEVVKQILLGSYVALTVEHASRFTSNTLLDDQMGQDMQYFARMNPGYYKKRLHFAEDEKVFNKEVEEEREEDEEEAAPWERCHSENEEAYELDEGIPEKLQWWYHTAPPTSAHIGGGEDEEEAAQWERCHSEDEEGFEDGGGFEKAYEQDDKVAEELPWWYNKELEDVCE